jgi:hypothetical protein
MLWNGFSLSVNLKGLGEAVVTYFKALTRYLFEKTVKNHQKRRIFDPLAEIRSTHIQNTSKKLYCVC